MEKINIGNKSKVAITLLVAIMAIAGVLAATYFIFFQQGLSFSVGEAVNVSAYSLAIPMLYAGDTAMMNATLINNADHPLQITLDLNETLPAGMTSSFPIVFTINGNEEVVVPFNFSLAGNSSTTAGDYTNTLIIGRE